MAKALENLKVLDFSRVYAGPLCTELLMDLGAEVIKVEMPGEGEPFRYSYPLLKGMMGFPFFMLNRGKKSITLNLKSERGCQIAKDLAKRVDIVVENFTPGVMDRLGLGYEELKKLNPKLIYASISGYGHTGPRSSEPAYDIVLQAMGGLLSVMGSPDSPPIKVAPSIANFMSGLYTTIAILAALHYRSEVGEGQMIDISMQDCVWTSVITEWAGPYFLYNKVERVGNNIVGPAPFSIYQAKDGYVIIAAALPYEWANLLKVMGREDLIGVERYREGTERFDRRDEVNAIVEEWTKTRSVEQILKQLRSAHIACSPLPTFDQVANDPQILNRRMIVEVDQPGAGKVKTCGSVFKLSKTPGNVEMPVPSVGENNYEVYSEMLGYSEQEIRRFADDGII